MNNQQSKKTTIDKNHINRYSGIIVFDVDGVILRGSFLIKILRSSSLVNYLRMMRTAISYYRGKTSFSEMINLGYGLASNVDVSKANKVFNKIKRVSNLKKTISVLKNYGYYISIISAGVPDFLLENIAKDIGADHYKGLEINVKKGELDLKNLKVIPKVKIVEELIEKLGFSWSDVISIADDPNNLELLKKSKLGIGYNPSRPVREKADIIIETNDFLELVPHIIPPDKLPHALGHERYSWRRELFRKLIHILGCGLPFLASIDIKITIALLGTTSALYLLSEILRKEGLKLFIFSQITTRAIRYIEKRRIALGPIFLATGIATTLLIFDKQIYFPAILIGSVSDSVSALIGKKIGKLKIPFSKMRTLEGSTGFFISALIILLFFYPLSISIIIAFISTLIELIPLYNLDNFLIPISTGFLLALFSTIF